MAISEEENIVGLAWATKDWFQFLLCTEVFSIHTKWDGGSGGSVISPGGGGGMQDHVQSEAI